MMQLGISCITDYGLLRSVVWVKFARKTISQRACALSSVMIEVSAALPRTTINDIAPE
jgi:hypothetical protein